MDSEVRMGCAAREDTRAIGASQDMMLRSGSDSGRLASGPASSWAHCFVSTAPA